MKKYSFAKCLLIILLFPMHLAGQPAELYSFENLNRPDGLSHSTPVAIFQDDEGFVWIGTENGLNKFDSVGFDVFMADPIDSTSLSGSAITVLYEDQYKNLWVGTNGTGLNLFHRDTQTFSHIMTDYEDHGSSISDNTITAIIEDSFDELWIGTMSGLNFYDRSDSTFVHFYANPDHVNIPTSSHITALEECSDLHLWIGTINGLNKRERETGLFHHFTHDPKDPHTISHNQINDLLVGENGRIWIATQAGLDYYDPYSNRIYRFAELTDGLDFPVSSVYKDFEGILWVGTFDQGLVRINPATGDITRIKVMPGYPNSLSGNNIKNIYETANRVLWVASENGGLSLLDLKPSNFEYYHDQRQAGYGLSARSVTSFLETEDELFLIGTGGGGVNVFDRGEKIFSEYDYSNHPLWEDLRHTVVLSLMEDRDGNIWTGYYNHGLTQYNPETGTVKQYQHDVEDTFTIGSNQVFSLHQDREGGIWVGANGGGVSQYDPDYDRFIRLTGFADGKDATRAIFHDSRDRLWVGSYGGSIRIKNRETHEVMTHYSQGDNGLMSHVILSIYEDSDQNIWLGSRGGGLHLYDETQNVFHSWSVRDGLPSQDIYNIQEDDHGNLWLSTDQGIARFHIEEEVITSFGLEHGLQSEEFLSLSGYKDSNGFIYFGGINGFNRFHPDYMYMDESVPPVVFTDFRLYNESVPIKEGSILKKHISRTDSIILPHDRYVLTLDYVSLNYDLKHPGNYSYMLEGFDSDWHYVGESRSATYTNLPSGEYLFKVRTANIAGIWGEEKHLHLLIVPPFWQTTWFYLITAFFITGFIFSAYQIRVQSIKKRNRDLEEKVDIRTHELYQSNKELRDALNEVKSMRNELVDKAHKAGMADLATGVLHNLGNILTSVTTSANIIESTVQSSRHKSLKRANSLLRENMNNIETFIKEDPRGKVLLEYYLELEQPLDQEAEKLLQHVKRMVEKIKLITDVVAAQQRFARAGEITEPISLKKIIEDTLKIQEDTIEKRSVRVVKQFEKTDMVMAGRSKIIHVLINLVKNAYEAMSTQPPEQKTITIKTWQDDKRAYLSVTDTGEGLDQDRLTKIFSHGFTTKEDGHGFGLHSSSNYMKEMGGELKASSDGKGKGATFTLVFPRLIAKKKAIRKVDKKA